MVALASLAVGVTIAKEIELEDQAVAKSASVGSVILAADQVENTGVQLIRQASAKTNDVAGDGTTHPACKDGSSYTVS